MNATQQVAPGTPAVDDDPLLPATIKDESWVMYGDRPSAETRDWEFYLIRVSDQNMCPLRNANVVRGNVWREIVAASKASREAQDRIGRSIPSPLNLRLTKSWRRPRNRGCTRRYRTSGAVGVFQQKDCPPPFDYSGFGTHHHGLSRLSQMPLV